jgi:hypothetical protein
VYVTVGDVAVKRGSWTLMFRHPSLLYRYMRYKLQNL